MKTYDSNTTQLCIVAALIAIGVLAALPSFAQIAQTPILGSSIPKYVEPLPHFAGARVTGTNLAVSVQEFQEMVLPASFYAALPAPAPGAPDFRLGTYVWGYSVGGMPAHYPGFTVEATRNVPTAMTYVNELPFSDLVTPPLRPFLQQYVVVDQTLHWADPLMEMGSMLPFSGPPPVVTHLHGGQVPSEFDGGPDQWFTPDGLKGLGYRTDRNYTAPTNGAVYIYNNAQEPTTLWFHDHALGATRLNVYCGLAAFYLLRDWFDATTNPNGIERPDLPGGPADTTVVDNSDPANPRTISPEIEIAIQDRMVDTNGQLFFPHAGINPTVHPFWVPEFFGDVVVVNGKTWPFLNVEPRRYRFRFLDGCNARFLRMWLRNMATGTLGPPIWQIGSDGGLLDAPVKLDPAALVPGYLFLSPGERADVVIDFSGFAGRTLTLRNNAKAPFPKGRPADPQTVGQIMQFRVGTMLSNPAGPTGDPSYDPATLQSPRISPIVPINTLPANVSVKRQLTLNEVMGPGGPLEILVNNTKWDGKRPDGTVNPGFTKELQGNYLSEVPTVGATEVWEIINLTADTHPIHLHLVQFQLINRQSFNASNYSKAYGKAFPGLVYIPAYGPPGVYTTLNADSAVGGNPAVTRFLQGPARPPLLEEMGWKDTVKMNPGEVTRIAVRFKQQDNTAFPFDATGTAQIAFDGTGALAGGPGYVWHCHIIDHEDNEMMRPYIPQ